MIPVRKKGDVDISKFEPAEGSVLVVFKQSSWKKVDVDKVSGQKTIVERKSFGYPVGRAVLVSPEIYKEVVKNLKIAEDYDPRDRTHLPPAKEHSVEALEAWKKANLPEEVPEPKATTRRGRKPKATEE